MYRKFREDPSSVDPSWHEFLVDYSPEPTNDATPRGNGRTGASPTTAPEPAPAPPPKPASSNGAANTKDTKSSSPAAKADAPAPKTAAPKAPAPEKAPKKAEAKTPEAPAKSTPAASGGQQPETQVLRGAAAAVVKNMSASLEVPTATSVRAIPAKAMIDNRIVINNHLKRTRGGKISFTHLLGYAIVQAVKKFPNMNRHFAEVDGKPNAVTPAHTNLGLAIDLHGKDGKRSARRRRDQELRSDELRPVHRGLRRHRAPRP